EQRCHGNLRNHLKRNDVRIKDFFGRPEQGKHISQYDAEHASDDESEEHFPSRRPYMPVEDAVCQICYQIFKDGFRRRKNKAWNPKSDAHQFPAQKESDGDKNDGSVFDVFFSPVRHTCTPCFPWFAFSRRSVVRNQRVESRRYLSSSAAFFWNVMSNTDAASTSSVRSSATMRICLVFSGQSSGTNPYP